MPDETQTEDKRPASDKGEAAQDETAEQKAEEKAPKRGLHRGLKWGAVAVAAVVVAAGGYWYHEDMTYHPSTSDAYVKANTVGIAAQVPGNVIEVPVSNQQPVAKGALLFRIDPQHYHDQVLQAQAALDQARQAVGAEEAAVQAAQARVADVQASLTTAKRTYMRDQHLAATGVASQAQLTSARDAYDSARAQLDLARAQLNQAQKTLGTPGKGNHKIEAATAALNQAKLSLSRTDVDAPCAGRLSGFRLRPGDVIAAGTNQGTLVCNKHFWVYANYKETALNRIRPGQHATITIDMYPGKTFHGIVESLNPASGAAFSLMPPENASGNWVKVTQRVPVKILITDAGPKYPMRVQTSAEVTINTGTGAQPLGRSRGATLTDAEAMKLAGAAQ